MLFPSAKSDPELAPYRAGLVFGFFNALTWQIGIGTPMVLFAERLGATSFQVGIAYAFVFLLTPVQIVATALLPRYGFKRLSLGGWGARSVFLAIPVFLTLLAPATGRPWMVHLLIWSVFFFCLARSIGAAAMTAWFVGLVPAPLRGRYFGSDQFFSSIASVVTLVACSALFALLPIYSALFVQYLIALAGSTASYLALKRLPDIERPSEISVRSVLRDTPRHLFAPSAFRGYLWCAVWYTVITTSIPPFAAYYLRVGAHLTPGAIMLFEVARYCGLIVGAALIRRRIDAAGARPFLLISLGATALVAVGWWCYLRFGVGGQIGMLAIYFGVGVGAVCWLVANLNYLPKVAPPPEQALLISIHGAVTACLGGCGTVLVGLVLKSTDAQGAPAVNVAVFEWFFGAVFASACVLSALVARLPEDNPVSPHPLVIGHAVLRPFRAAAFLAELFAPKDRR